MNKVRWLLAGLGGFLTLFLFGGLWHIGLFKDFYYGPEMSGLYRSVDGSKHGQIMLADLLRGLVLAWLYPYGYKPGSPVLSQGLRFGLAAGLFLLGTWVLMADAVMNVPAGTYVLRESAFSLIQGTLAGLVIALIWGSKGKKA